jgi:hypothetical protein
VKKKKIKRLAKIYLWRIKTRVKRGKIWIAIYFGIVVWIPFPIPTIKTIFFLCFFILIEGENGRNALRLPTKKRGKKSIEASY